VRLSQWSTSEGIAHMGSNHGKPMQKPARRSLRGLQNTISPGRGPINTGFDAATTVARLSDRATLGARTRTPQIVARDLVDASSSLNSPSDHAYASHVSQASAPPRIAYDREALKHQIT